MADTQPAHADPCIALQKNTKFVVPSILLMFVSGVLMLVRTTIAVTTVFGILFWFFFYLLLMNLLETIIPGGLEMRPVTSNTSVGCTWVCLIHQLVICVVLMVYLLTARSDSSAPSWWEGLQPWWTGGWEGWSMTVERQMYYCVAGYELKDFTRRGLSVAFIAHHAFVFGGCALCLLIPGAVGIVTFNALNAEIGSGFYNLDTLFGPSWLCFGIFFVCMNLSNGIAAWGISELFEVEGLDLKWKVPYAVLACLLIALRTGGVVLGVMAYIDWSKKKTFVETQPTHLESLTQPTDLESEGVANVYVGAERWSLCK